MLAVPTMHLDHNGLITEGIGVHGRAAECLSPVSGESLDMLWMKTMAERMSDNLVRHHSTVPGVGKSAQALDATHRVEESLHASMMTILSCLFNTIPESSRSVQCLVAEPWLPDAPSRFGAADTCHDASLGIRYRILKIIRVAAVGNIYNQRSRNALEVAGPGTRHD